MSETARRLGRDFTTWELFRFALPRMGMSLFIMSYMVADGALISHYLGTNALAALNLVWPLSSVLMAFGIMLSAGGASVIARRLGAGDKEGAECALSSIFIAEAILGALLGFLGWVFLDQLLVFLEIGPEEAPYAEAYQYVALATMPALLVNVAAQTFFTTAGFPKVGLAVSIASGVTNVVLDILFMGPMGFGMTGAAWATSISWMVCVACAWYFFRRRNAALRFSFRIPEWRAVKNAATSGVSEMVAYLSHAVTLFLFNSAFQKALGVDGVAALTVAMYASYVFNAIFYGLSEAISPVIGYNYGNRNWTRLKRVLNEALVLLAVFSLSAYALSYFFADDVLAVFVDGSPHVSALVADYFPLYALSLLFTGPNLFAAYLFTAFGDGRRATIVSFSHTFLFVTGAILLFPKLFGEIGLWLSAPGAEAAAFVLSAFMILANRRRYGYDGREAERINEA